MSLAGSDIDYLHVRHVVLLAVPNSVMSAIEAEYLNNDVSNSYGSINDSDHARAENGATAARLGQSFCNVPQEKRQLGQYLQFLHATAT